MGGSSISAGRFTDSQLIYQHIWSRQSKKSASQNEAWCFSDGTFTWLSVNLPSDMEIVQSGNLLARNRVMDISASRFTDCHLICQQIWRRQSGNLQGRNGGYFCWQVYWLSINLPTDLERYALWNLPAERRGLVLLQADLLTDQINMPAKMGGNISASTINWQSVNLPADLETVRKSAGRNGG